jgi:hypothetical protein
MGEETPPGIGRPTHNNDDNDNTNDHDDDDDDNGNVHTLSSCI